MNIVLGVTGGIAAYKTPELVRRLRDAGADVRVILTPNATRFVASLALAMPFAMSRAEVRDARRRFLGIDPAVAQLDAAQTAREIAGIANSAERPRGELVARGPGFVPMSGLASCRFPF